MIRPKKGRFTFSFIIGMIMGSKLDEFDCFICTA